jgi:hypothetical protein
MRSQFSTLNNSLGIVQTDFVWNLGNSHLVLIIETDQMLAKEIDARVRGNTLILEAPLLSDYEMPFKTHLIGQELRKEIEEGYSDIGISEVKLKPGYQYSLITCEVVEPKLIKVIFEFRSLAATA